MLCPPPPPILPQAPAETLADALAAISNLRISAHPNLTTTPVFMPKRKQQPQQQQQVSGGKGGQRDTSQQQAPKAKPGKQQQQQKPKQGQGKQATSSKPGQPRQQRQRLSAAASRAAAADSRVQDDSIFGDFEAELLCDELLQKQPPQAAA